MSQFFVGQKVMTTREITVRVKAGYRRSIRWTFPTRTEAEIVEVTRSRDVVIRLAGPSEPIEVYTWPTTVEPFVGNLDYWAAKLGKAV